MEGVSQSELSRILGISITNLRKHLSKEHAPAPKPSGKYDAEEVKGFIESERQKDNQKKSGSDYKKTKAATELFRAKLLEVKYKEQIGLLVDKRVAEKAFNELAVTIKSEGDQLQAKLPPLLAGKDLPEMSRIIDKAWRDVCRSIAAADVSKMF